MKSDLTPVILGSDGGGSKILYGLVPVESTEVAVSSQLPTPDNLIEFAVQLDLVCNDWAQKEGYEVAAVSLGFAGKNDNNVIMVNSPHMHWLNGVNVVEWGKYSLDLPMLVFNDLEILGRAEREVGALKNMQPGEGAIVFTLGQGYGGCEVYVVQIIDQVITIVRPCEPGHMTLYSTPGNTASCGCKNPKGGCVEGIVSGGAQEFQTGRLLNLYGATENVGDDPDDPNVVLEKIARNGEEWAKKHYRQVGDVLGWALTNWLMVFQQAKTIVYTGSIALNTMDLMQETVEARIKSHPMAPDILIKPTELGAEGAALGSVLLFEDYAWKTK